MFQRVLGYHFLSTCRLILQFPVVTWAERIARQLLDALTFTNGAAVERGGVGTAARALLVATATAAVAHRPLCPRGPSSVNCWRKQTRTVTVLLKYFLEYVAQKYGI